MNASNHQNRASKLLSILTATALALATAQVVANEGETEALATQAGNRNSSNQSRRGQSLSLPSRVIINDTSGSTWTDGYPADSRLRSHCMSMSLRCGTITVTDVEEKLSIGKFEAELDVEPQRNDMLMQ